MKKLLYLLMFLPLGLFGQGETVNVGTTANDHTGDPLRTAFQKVNTNFSAVRDTFASALQLVNILPIQYVKTQLSGALTDGTPTDTEIDTVTELTPATATAGYRVTIKDTNGTGLLYLVESDGSSWFYIVMTQAVNP